MMRSSVLLPQPDGPISEMNSPRANREIDADERLDAVACSDSALERLLPTPRSCDDARRSGSAGGVGPGDLSADTSGPPDA